jgi:hypothetical protein
MICIPGFEGRSQYSTVHTVIVYLISSQHTVLGSPIATRLTQHTTDRGHPCNAQLLKEAWAKAARFHMPQHRTSKSTPSATPVMSRSKAVEIIEIDDSEPGDCSHSGESSVFPVAWLGTLNLLNSQALHVRHRHLDAVPCHRSPLLQHNSINARL